MGLQACGVWGSWAFFHKVVLPPRASHGEGHLGTFCPKASQLLLYSGGSCRCQEAGGCCGSTCLAPGSAPGHAQGCWGWHEPVGTGY